MSNIARRSARFAAAAGLAAAALLTTGSPALAHAHTAVQLQVSVVTSGTTGAATSTLNAGATTIASTSCALDGVTVACGTPTDKKKSTTYVKSLSALAPGTHEYYQIVYFVDGSLTQGSALFTIA